MAKLPITPSKGLSSILKYGYGILDDLGFFSRAEKVIDLLPPKAQVGKGSDIITKIEEIGGKPVKDELLFTGLKDEFIESPRVTSQELKDYLNSNKTMIQEKVRSTKKSEEQKAKQAKEGDGFEEYLQDTIYYGRPDAEGGASRYNQGVPDWVTIEGFDVGGGDVSFTQGLTQINALPLNSLKSTTRTLFSTKNNDLNLDVRGSSIVEEGEQNKFLEDFLIRAEQTRVPFVEIKKDGTDITTIGNNDVGWLTYLKSNLPDNLRGENNVVVSGSLNEAQLQANRLQMDIEKPELKDKTYGEPDIDLKPKHEQYTVGGGDNYQEIILTSKDKPDKYLEKIGDVSPDLINDLQANKLLTSVDDKYLNFALNEVVVGYGNTTKTGQRLYRERLKKLAFSDKTINDLDKAFKNNPQLSRDNLLNLLVLGKKKIFSKNYEVTDTGEIFITKPDFSVDVHFPEKNILVYARTKDRVDEDGGKNLATEELQSDLSQKGRSRGLALGLREQKQFINKRSPVLHGDVLDAYEELEAVSNIGDLRFNSMLFDETRNKDQAITRDTDADKFFDGTKQYLDVDINKYTIPEMLNASNTKYKFHETKDANSKMLTDMGFSKGDDASTIDEFYNKKASFLPYGQRTTEQTQDLIEVYQNDNRDIFNIYQQNKNKLYSKVDDFASSKEIKQLSDIVKAERGLLSNKIARDEIVFNYPRPDGETQSFMVDLKDNPILANDGMAYIDRDRVDFKNVANTRYIVENEFTPEEKQKYDDFAKTYFNENKASFAQVYGVVLKPDQPNPVFTFQEFKSTPDYYRKTILTKYLSQNELPKKTQDRIEGYITQLNNFVKKDDHFGKGGNAGRIDLGVNNYDDYLKKQNELGSATPIYGGGNQQYAILANKFQYGMQSVRKILAENNNEIDKLRKTIVGPVVNDFKLDYGNADREDIFKKLKNLDESTEKLKIFKSKTERNSETEIPSLPFLGDSKKFAEVGIKRLILKAVEDGYDSVSILPAHVHVERWQEPNLKQFYDRIIPSVVKDILKGTGQQAQIKKIFPNNDARNRYQVIKNMEDITNELLPQYPEFTKTEFLNRGVNYNADDILQDIDSIHRYKYGQPIGDEDIRARLKILLGMRQGGVESVDDLFNGTIKKEFLSETSTDNLSYNKIVKDLYVGQLGSYDGKNSYLPSITIKLTPELKEYAQSGISLYTSLPVTVGAGAVTAQQILGTEEDIVEEEDDVL